MRRGAPLRNHRPAQPAGYLPRDLPAGCAEPKDLPVVARRPRPRQSDSPPSAAFSTSIFSNRWCHLRSSPCGKLMDKTMRLWIVGTPLTRWQAKPRRLQNSKWRAPKPAGGRAKARHRLPKMADSQSAAGCQPAVRSAAPYGGVELCDRVSLTNPHKRMLLRILQLPLLCALVAAQPRDPYATQLARLDAMTNLPL